MNKNSRGLIDDLVLLHEGAHWQAARIDLTMMAGLGAKEAPQKDGTR